MAMVVDGHDPSAYRLQLAYEPAACASRSARVSLRNNALPQPSVQACVVVWFSTKNRGCHIRYYNELRRLAQERACIDA